MCDMMQSEYDIHKNIIRKRLIISVILLVAISTTAVVTSFAWISLSTRPSVESISTTVSSNGGLEIALLSTSTYENPDLIRSAIGSSMDSQESYVANLTWGNIIDLSSTYYGLNEIGLFPSMINMEKQMSGREAIGTSILKIPSYGYDGRVITLDVNSVSGIYEGGLFTVNTQKQTHGVRAIGTADTLSVQQKIFIASRSSMNSSNTIALQTAETVIAEKVWIIFDMYKRVLFEDNAVYTSKDISRIGSLSGSILKILQNIEHSIRQGLIAILTSEIGDEEEFEKYYTLLSDTDKRLSEALNSIPFTFSGSAAIGKWISEVEKSEDEIDSIRMLCETATVSQMSNDDYLHMLNAFVSRDGIYIGDEKMSSINTLSADKVLNVMPGSGTLSLVADYVGSYNEYAKGFKLPKNQSQMNVKIRTANKTGNLYVLYGIISELNAFNSDITTAQIKDICGFAVDMAFRVNADNAYLKLKTEDELFGLIDLPSHSGSYMIFSEENVSADIVDEIMSAVRITFIDSEGTVLGTAKLDMEDVSEYEDKRYAPLYLYEFYNVDGMAVTNGRKDSTANLTLLIKNKPTIITAVVWLDGNRINNTLTANIGRSVTAILNMQFMTDSELIPSGE